MSDIASQPYDALLIVSFGGPEGMDDVVPFLENVLRGKNVPRERLLEVAHHYERFGGVSPLNGHIRSLIAALQTELDNHGPRLPIYWGNRNWHPLLSDTMQQMADAGVGRVLAFATSAYSSYSGCRQYLEDIARARAAVGEAAPVVDKLRPFFNHPRFVAASCDRLRAALDQLSAGKRDTVRIAFTAHSIPASMAGRCAYEQQLIEVCRLVTTELKIAPERWQLVYQSRSGRPGDPWLEPDILDHLKSLHLASVRDVIVMPIGFLSDHMEVLYDLDVEACELCQSLGMNMIRAQTVGTHPEIVRMLRELIVERTDSHGLGVSVGFLPACPNVCPADCCPKLG
ncbi:MAG: ferrochelatase [Planctomycetales bacterium]|nr:ferrochelatase [Planctomycetales bacterium]